MQDVQHRRLAYEATVLTSTPTIRAAMQFGQEAPLRTQLAGMRSAGIIDPTRSVREALDSVDRWMLGHYRSESLYKNRLAEQILLQRHSWQRASLLTEFRVASSIADCVIVNGRSTAYEIKTELDNPARLVGQLRNYFTAFRSVVIVTHRSLARSYLDATSDLPVGVIALTDDGQLRTRRKPQVVTSHLSIDVIMKTLRKPEYTRVAERIAGTPIDAPPTQHFRQCLEIAHTVSPVDYSRLAEGELRLRMPRQAKAISEGRFKSLRHQLIALNPTAKQLRNVEAWMDRSVTDVSAVSAREAVRTARSEGAL